MAELPVEVEQTIKAHVDAAVKAFRAGLGFTVYGCMELPTPTRGQVVAAFEQVLLPSMRHHFENMAREAFEKCGKEYVRRIVLDVFDKVVGGEEKKDGGI